ncbi:hypothetical protein HK100_000806 [Physocladia obscura]|uniref:Uncharacterized protein n=1 Tax=Physocladia obscura TaxID=109957 RepID=A0AAD5T3U6_9FUNG|nr:hypothetical protein HK100_000806 [Physocladia obscura]
MLTDDSTQHHDNIEVTIASTREFNELRSAKMNVRYPASYPCYCAPDLFKHHAFVSFNHDFNDQVSVAAICGIKRNGDDDDIDGLKILKFDPTFNENSGIATKFAKMGTGKSVPINQIIPPLPPPPRIEMLATENSLSRDLLASIDDSSDDDLGGNPVMKKKADHTIVPVKQNDDASDYYPSDIEDVANVAEDNPRNSVASAARRAERCMNTVHRMAGYFSNLMPRASAKLFNADMCGRRVPFYVTARLRRWCYDEDRWSDRGPVVCMFLPCADDGVRVTQSRLVAHFLFGTQSVALNMPISDVHGTYVISPNARVTMFSSLNQNIIPKVITTTRPRRIHDILNSNLSARDARLLKETCVSSSNRIFAAAAVEEQKNTDFLATAVAKRLDDCISGKTNKNNSSSNRMGKLRNSREAEVEESDEESDHSGGFNTPKSRRDGRMIVNNVDSQVKTRAINVSNNPDYVLECKSTIVGVKEESASVFMLLFDKKDDRSRFNERFAKAANDFADGLVQARIETMIIPQVVKRVLLSGQMAVFPGGATNRSPLSIDPVLVRKIAETGLIYIPSIPPAEAQFESKNHSQLQPCIQHRLVCTHCHAALAICTKSNSSNTAPNLPTFEEVCIAHAEHAYAKRVAGRGKINAGQVYRCVYAMRGVGGEDFYASSSLSSLLGDFGVSSGGGSGKKWTDLVVVN